MRDPLVIVIAISICFFIVVAFGAVLIWAVANQPELDCQPLGNFQTRSVYTHMIKVGSVNVPQYQTRRQEEYLCRDVETGATKNIWMAPARQEDSATVIGTIHNKEQPEG